MPPDRDSQRDDPDRSAPELILAGRAFVRGRLRSVEIAIGADGRIQSLGKVRSGAPRRDVGDAVILPAAIDPHVHLREPGGPTAGESIPSGTVEAALGGVTLVGDMPNTEPPVDDVEAVESKVRRVQGRAAVDVLIFASTNRSAGLERLARVAGGFKLFLSPTTGVSEVPRLEDVPHLLERLARLGLPVTVHAEDPTRFTTGVPPRDPVGWNGRRPVAAEESALTHLLPAPAALRLNVAHVTTVEAVTQLRRAGVAFEATPHHLLLSDRSGRDARFKVNPPLRAEKDRQRLWEAFGRGEVPLLASDHAPHPREAKEDLPFEKAPSGMPGVETMLPLLLAETRAGNLDLGVLLAAACERPARWFGQPLGRIAPGHRANLLVVDFRLRSRIDAHRLHAPCGWTAFEGREAIFPREHYRDGERIVEDGEYVGRPGGKVVRPEFAPGERREPERERPPLKGAVD